MTIRIIDDVTILFTPEKYLTFDPLTLQYDPRGFYPIDNDGIKKITVLVHGTLTGLVLKEVLLLSSIFFLCNGLGTSLKYRVLELIKTLSQSTNQRSS